MDSTGENKKINRVIVVMAVYNGEKYLKRQLDSIISQSNKDIEIYIRDDGSSDNSVNIIKKYECKYDSVHMVKDDLGNLKPPASFYAILQQCPEAEYYSFADQDDIWYRDKIKYAVEMLDRENQDIPAVYFSRHKYIDDSGRFIRNFPVQKRINIYRCLFNSPGSGFTFVINKKAKDEFIPYISGHRAEYCEMHDRWLARSAVCFGKVVYDRRITAAHVRHPSAVTKEDNNNLTLLISSVKNEFLGNETKREKYYLRQFYRFYRNRLGENEKKVILLFGKRKNTLKRRMEKLFFPHRLMTRISGEIIVRSLILTGRI